MYFAQPSEKIDKHAQSFTPSPLHKPHRPGRVAGSWRTEKLGVAGLETPGSGRTGRRTLHWAFVIAPGLSIVRHAASARGALGLVGARIRLPGIHPPLRLARRPRGPVSRDHHFPAPAA